jgi:histidinol-phosphate phosphatase family protein
VANRAVFLDRDDTMARDVPYCSRPEDFELFPNTAKAIKLLNEHGYSVIVVTNQSGVARGYFTEDVLDQIHRKMLRQLAEEGARIDGIYYCPHHPDENCECRKPKPQMVLQAVNEHDIDLKRSFMVGDKPMDIRLGQNVGCRTVLIPSDAGENDSKSSLPDYTATDLYQAALWIINQK